MSEEKIGYIDCGNGNTYFYAPNQSGIVNINIKSLTKLVEYLIFHEANIAIGINDFGDLQDVFCDIIKRAPKEDADC